LVVAPCSLVEVYQRFRGHLHVLIRKLGQIVNISGFIQAGIKGSRA
jgi:hypothetical protein